MTDGRRGLHTRCSTADRTGHATRPSLLYGGIASTVFRDVKSLSRKGCGPGHAEFGDSAVAYIPGRAEKATAIAGATHFPGPSGDTGGTMFPGAGPPFPARVSAKVGVPSATGPCRRTHPGRCAGVWWTAAGGGGTGGSHPRAIRQAITLFSSRAGAQHRRHAAPVHRYRYCRHHAGELPALAW
jgi:hypothetical protein